MAKKKEAAEINEQEDRGCRSCSEWSNEDPVEFPCALAKVVVARARPRVNCNHWRAAR